MQRHSHQVTHINSFAPFIEVYAGSRLIICVDILNLTSSVPVLSTATYSIPINVAHRRVYPVGGSFRLEVVVPIIQHLRADEFGTQIGRRAGRLKLSRDGRVLQQAPLLHLESVTLIGRGITISTDAIAGCCEWGVPIFLTDHSGWVYGVVHGSKPVGTVATRREQLRAGDDWRGVHLAKRFCYGKIRGKAANLRYWARLRRDTYPELALHLTDAASVLDRLANELDADIANGMDTARAAVMGLEGAAAQAYWQAAARIIPQKFGWIGRRGRGATDPVNSLLNYGYGILYAEVERALLQAGLDPYAGFLHTDRPGKPSLVLDLIEEFRTMAVDRVVIGLVARQYTVVQEPDGLLSVDIRRDFAAKILDQLARQARTGTQRMPLRQVLQRQAQQIASFVRGECTEYTPYTGED